MLAGQEPGRAALADAPERRGGMEKIVYSLAKPAAFG